MKRILAIIMVLAMVFAFAACKPKDDGKDTTAPGVSGDAVTNDNNESVPADASEADASEAESTDAAEVSTDASGKPVETTSQGGAQTDNKNGLNSTDAKAVVDFYNKAVKASVKNPPKGKQTMKLEKLHATGGFVAKIIASFESIAKKALEKNSTETTWIPAGDHGDVNYKTDVKNAKATSDGKYTTIYFDVNPQTDGPNESSSKGPVGRSIGTLGNVQNAIDELPGVSIEDGINNIKLTYDHAYVTVKVDNSTKKIVSGTWHYKVNVNANNLKVKVGLISSPIDTLTGIVDYTVKIG
jgi:hypothetical protein